jgi:hypothetical protein
MTIDMDKLSYLASRSSKGKRRMSVNDDLGETMNKREIKQNELIKSKVKKIPDS